MGGATYLDRDQVFYQIVFKETSVVPKDVKKMFERFLSVTVARAHWPARAFIYILSLHRITYTSIL